MPCHGPPLAPHQDWALHFRQSPLPHRQWTFGNRRSKSCGRGGHARFAPQTSLQEGGTGTTCSQARGLRPYFRRAGPSGRATLCNAVRVCRLFHLLTRRKQCGTKFQKMQKAQEHEKKSIRSRMSIRALLNAIEEETNNVHYQEPELLLACWPELYPSCETRGEI